LIITHPVTEDPTDYKGYPCTVVEKDGSKSAVFLPFGDLKKLVQVPEGELVIHFADDLGPAAKMVQAAYMQLVWGRRVNGHEVANNVVFIAASNRKQDKAAVKSIIEPLKGRYTSIVELVTNLEDWSNWYNKQNLPHHVLDYIRWRPEVLDEWKPTPDMSMLPTPRGMEHVAKMLKAGVPEHLKTRMFAGAIGKARAMEFVQFLDIYSKLPDINEVLANPKNAPIPTEPGYIYALGGALAARVEKDTFDSILTYSNRIENELDMEEFNIMIIRDCINKDNTLAQNDAFHEWVSNHEDVLI
jgi:hypothetical protein